jgi:hypothetical protein
MVSGLLVVPCVPWPAATYGYNSPLGTFLLLSDGDRLAMDETYRGQTHQFTDSELAAERKRILVPSVRLCIEKKTDDPNVLSRPRAILDGTLKITGVAFVECRPNENWIRHGMQAVLKVKGPDGSFTRLAILLVNLVDITTPSPGKRLYQWEFWVVERPERDPFGLFPVLPQGEVSLELLIEQLGAAPEEVNWKARFTSEGGISQIV